MLQGVIARAGGLSVDALAFLLAVQAIVRDDVLSAYETLRPTQAQLVAAWRDRLDDHEAELKQALGLTGGGALEPLTRPVEPSAVTVVLGAIDERDLDKPFVGESVYRYPRRRKVARGLLGLVGGALFGLLGAGLGHVRHEWIGVAILAGVIVFMAWGILTAPAVMCCATCDAMLGVTDKTCGRCGGSVVGEIAHRADRLVIEEDGHGSPTPRTRAEKLAARAAAQVADREAAEAEAVELARRRAAGVESSTRELGRERQGRTDDSHTGEGDMNIDSESEQLRNWYVTVVGIGEHGGMPILDDKGSRSRSSV